MTEAAEPLQIRLGGPAQDTQGSNTSTLPSGSRAHIGANASGTSACKDTRFKPRTGRQREEVEDTCMPHIRTRLDYVSTVSQRSHVYVLWLLVWPSPRTRTEQQPMQDVAGPSPRGHSTRFRTNCRPRKPCPLCPNVSPSSASPNLSHTRAHQLPSQAQGKAPRVATHLLSNLSAGSPHAKARPERWHCVRRPACCRW